MSLDYQGNAREIFEDNKKRKIFFGLVKGELKQPGRELDFMIRLERPIIGKDGKRKTIGDLIESPEIPSFSEDSEEDEKAPRFIDSGLSLSPEEFMFAEALGAERIDELIEKNGKSNLAASLREIRVQKIASLYQQIRSGEIKNWKYITQKRDLHFFRYDLNLQETIRYVTKEYILPNYQCSLEDLPIQPRMWTCLDRLQFRLTYQIKKKGGRYLRDLFLLGFPEMSDSPHWHTSRWSQQKIRGRLSEEEKKEYSRFRRDYVFRYSLGCRTKEDVINTINEKRKLTATIRKERLPIFNRKEVFNHKTTLYHMILGLEGEMYEIAPWEVNLPLPHYTFTNRDGGPNLENIIEYLKWADGKHGISLKNICRGNKHIPHFTTLIWVGLTPEQIRKLCPNPKELWEAGVKMSPHFTWINRDKTPNLERIRRYLKWVKENYGMPTSNGSKIPYFESMYRNSRLSFCEIKKMLDEIKTDEE